MQTSDLNVNNTKSEHANAIFGQFHDAVFAREHTYLKTLTRIIFDLLQWQEIAKLSLPKKAASLLSSEQHFARIFASEPMTLREIDRVPFFSRACVDIFRRMKIDKKVDRSMAAEREREMLNYKDLQDCCS